MYVDLTVWLSLQDTKMGITKYFLEKGAPNLIWPRSNGRLLLITPLLWVKKCVDFNVRSLKGSSRTWGEESWCLEQKWEVTWPGILSGFPCGLQMGLGLVVVVNSLNARYFFSALCKSPKGRRLCGVKGRMDIRSSAWEHRQAPVLKLDRKGIEPLAFEWSRLVTNKDHERLKTRVLPSHFLGYTALLCLVSSQGEGQCVKTMLRLDFLSTGTDGG